MASEPKSAAEQPVETSLAGEASLEREPMADVDGIGKIEKTDEQWREQLAPGQFEVTRKKGTERAYTGKYWNNKADGMYACVCCGNRLFDSKTKYKSGTGWPSFWAPVSEERVHTETDSSFGMIRKEVSCRRCGAHLGHVFEDGPPPTGHRYCLNSAALNFVKR